MSRQIFWPFKAQVESITLLMAPFHLGEPGPGPGIWLLTYTPCWKPWRHEAVGMCLFFTFVSPLSCSNETKISAVSRDFKTQNNKGKIRGKILQQVPVYYTESDFLTNLISMPLLFCHPVAYKQLSWTDVKLLTQQFLNAPHNPRCIWFLFVSHSNAKSSHWTILPHMHTHTTGRHPVRDDIHGNCYVVFLFFYIVWVTHSSNTSRSLTGPNSTFHEKQDTSLY